MGISRRGYRGNFWTPEEVAQLLEMEGVKRPRAETAKALGRTISSIEGKLRLVRLEQDMGPLLGPGQGRYQAPAFKENDELKHLKAIHAANGHGFVVCPPELVARIYRLETAPKTGRAFWNAA